MPGTRCLVPSLLLLASALAQERRPAFGHVVDAAGAPVIGAEVMLFTATVGELGAAATDRVVATTDARGQFMAGLLPTRAYAAFARGPLQADGSAWSSDADHLVAAGANVTFQLRDRATPRQVLVRGTAAWPELAPFRLGAVLVAAQTAVVEVPLVGDGATLPPLPAIAGFVVFDAQHEPLAVRWERDAGSGIDVAPPQPVEVEVVDAQGAGVAGAEVRVGLGFVNGGAQHVPWLALTRVSRRLGVTGSDGKASLLAPAAEGYEVCASRPGRGDARDEWRAGPQGRAIAPRLQLERTHAVRLVDGERGLATCGATICGWQSERLVADAEGVIELSHRSLPAVLVLDPFAVEVGDRRSVTTACIDVRSGGVPDLIDCAKLRRVSVTVLGADAAPAAAMPLFIEPPSGSMRPSGSMWSVQHPICSDQGGRVELLLSEGEWLLVGCDGEQAGWCWVDPNDAAAAPTLRLAPLACMRMRVLDGAGLPIAGAWIGGNSGMGLPGRPKDYGDAPAGLVWLLGNRLGGRTSDRDGCLDLHWLDRGPVAWRFWVTATGNRHSQQLTAVDDPGTIDVVVRRP